MSAIKPPPKDAYVGMEEYGSVSPGIGGRLKEEPGDFIVEEIASDGRLISLEGDVPGDMTPGDYTHFTIVKKNWETNRAIKEIAKRLGVSAGRFAFAGTKDKRAVTAQEVSVYQVPIERLTQVNIKDITLKDFTYQDENIGLGSLWGNRFKIRVRGISADAEKRINDIAGELAAGFSNYYGHQRFGDVRPITHEVGKLMLFGDYKAAVLAYLTRSFGWEGGDVETARAELAKSGDFRAALRDYPLNLGYETAMLNHLVQHEGDYIGAIRTLPKSLQKMFVHAYQSHVFNRALSECIRRKLAVETLPLVGVDVGADDISAKILAADGIKVEDFRLEGMGELKSKGEYRSCFGHPHELIWGVTGCDAVFDFRLQKGSYATVLLREFMKNS